MADSMDLSETSTIMPNMSINETIDMIRNFSGFRPVEVYKHYTTYLNGYIAPMVCVFGILGNILNLLVLSRKRFTTSMDSMERTVQMNLFALAVSDMLVCCIALPQTIMPTGVGDTTIFSIKLLFKYVETPLANTFILTSTWLTVSMTIGRYIAVCLPLHARSIVDARCTRSAIASVYLLSIAINLPRFWLTEILPVKNCQSIAKFYSIDPSTVTANTTCYIVNYSDLGRNMTFRFSFVTVVFVIGFLLPFLILVYCNVNLIQALRRARRIQRELQADQNYRQQKDTITPTLITIIIAFTVLVSPGEIFQYIVTNSDGYISNRNFIHAITNLLTLVNFSTNFVLYVAVNKSFRRTLKSILIGCFKRAKPSRDGSTRKYQTVAYTMSRTSNHEKSINNTEL